MTGFIAKKIFGEYLENKFGTEVSLKAYTGYFLGFVGHTS
jgi:hypothetical protein